MTRGFAVALPELEPNMTNELLSPWVASLPTDVEIVKYQRHYADLFALLIGANYRVTAVR